MQRNIITHHLLVYNVGALIICFSMFGIGAHNQFHKIDCIKNTLTRTCFLAMTEYGVIQR